MTAACSVHGVARRFGGVQALDGVDLEVQPGTVHALVGENGAGKSTLMKILAGAERPDAGEVRIKGERAELGNVVEAQRHGVAIVFQELSLYPHLDVLTNLFMPGLPRRRALVDRRRMRDRADDVLAQVGLSVDLGRPAGELGLDEQQLVEIARALLAESDVLILDEPNSALNAGESARVFEVVRRLRDSGVAIVYVSHRLEEVMAIADAITVLRNGRIAERLDPAKTTIPQVVTAMIGRRPSELRQERRPREATGPPLRIEGLSVRGRLENISLEARPGEIVGLAGLEGAGVADVFDVVFGMRSPDEGRVTLPSGDAGPASVAAAVRAGVARVPADRRTAGLMLERSIADNVSQVSIGGLHGGSFLVRRGFLAGRARARGEDLRIKMASPWTPATQLSGGNQQKVVIAKWLEAEPGIFVLDDPTRGVDVGAKAEIYGLIREMADAGRIVLFSSTELREYELLCDRVVVLYAGAVREEMPGREATEQRLLEAINTGLATA